MESSLRFRIGASIHFAAGRYYVALIVRVTDGIRKATSLYESVC